MTGLPSSAVSRHAVWLLFLASAAALAQYPDRPIRLIVSYPPGGGTDVTARAIVGRYSELLGRQIVIDNRPGAGSTTGTDLVAVGSTPEQFGKFVANEISKWTKVVRDAGIKAE